MKKQSILCISINKETVSSLKNYFADRFNLHSIPTAQQLLNKVIGYKPSLIFMNNHLPDFNNCQELCIAIRSRIDTETVPIIILTDDKEFKEKISLFQAALIDGYFTMPINIEELAAYANVFLQRQALQEELEKTNKLLSQTSVTDDLMQIYNRRYLMRRLDEELDKIKRYKYPLSALMIDLDFFKEVNDKFGHLQGDAALKTLAVILKKNVRNMDIICRYGGEEIVILLPHINFHGAQLTAERLRTKVMANDFGTKDMSIKLTISLGLVSFDELDELDVDTVIRALDQQLYVAKNTGRNRISAVRYKQTLE